MSFRSSISFCSTSGHSNKEIAIEKYLILVFLKYLEEDKRYANSAWILARPISFHYTF